MVSAGNRANEVGLADQLAGKLLAKSGLPVKGVSGNAKPFHDQDGAQIRNQSGETFGQSCHTTTRKKSTQFRLRLSPQHASRWMELTPSLREQAANIVFGAFTEGVDLGKLVVVSSELKQARLSIINLLQLALLRDSAINTEQAEAVLERIASLLGEKL